jgi:hypothetical protein
MAGNTSDALIDVNIVLEIDKVRQMDVDGMPANADFSTEVWQ